MSDPELAYMNGANDDFDLPRWQTHAPSSAATPATHSPSYHYSPNSQSRPPHRIAQLIDEDTQPGTALPYLAPSQNQLSRSASLNAAGRDHQRQPPSTSFYNASVAYQTPPYNPQAQAQDPAADYQHPQQDMYFSNPSAPGPPKRSNTHHDSSSTAAARAARSPLRATANQLLDPYAQQSQYSPTSATYHHQHSRSHSLTKPTNDSPYSPAVYSPSYPMETTSPAPPPPRQNSISTPNTPLGFPTPHSPAYYGQEPMAVDPPAKRRASGFRRIRDHRDLRPTVNPRPSGRRADSSGAFLSPLRQLTTNIVDTYRICNPQFKYESGHNPRRVLTKPSKPAHNDGYDNDDYDYILYVNDWLGTEEGHKYLILDVLGQGTFGQVVKCQDMKTHDIVAVKVVKNKPAYFNQSMMEVTILELLNNQCDPHDEHHILRLRDSFIHRSHLCLVFELLSSNLYELIKQNQFQGLSTQLVKVFTAQLLDALTVLKEARLIHCDLKPENILLKSLQSPQIKVIDFGSACHERQTVYTYIQSRFYRSPEVLLGLPYTAAIDMWSLGCIAVELFLGLPLFPGTSEYNQITRIVEMLGQPPSYMMEMGKQTGQFFDSYPDMYGRKKYRLKSLEQYSREHNTQEQPGKQYFKATTLPEIINGAPMPTFKTGRQGTEMDKELNNRASFIDFCQGLLNMNPIERWSPQQARMHPFITGEKFTKPFVPSGHTAQQPSTTSTPAVGGTPDAKRPYGGLVPSQPKGTRAYQDAATYNQQLAHHQAYTAQAQAASQAANNVFRNPYLATQAPQPPPSAYDSAGSAYPHVAGQQQPQQPPQQQQQHPSFMTPGQRSSASSGSQQQVYTTNPSGASGGSSSSSNNAPLSAGGLHPNPPTNSYYPSSRARANTINNMDNVPPALARLQHMNQDVIGGRNALTPVLNRDDAMKEWERRQQGGKQAAQPYPQLEFLQQQVELAAAQGLTGWAQGPSGTARYGGAPPTSGLAHQYHPQLVDNEQRDAILSNVRAVARTDGPASTTAYGAAANVIPSPPQAYSGAPAPNTGTRYAAAYAQQSTGVQSQGGVGGANAGGGGNASNTGYDRSDISLYVPMQPDQYQSYGPATGAGRGGGVPPPGASVPVGVAVPPSFYGAAVAGAQHQHHQQQQHQQQGSPQRNPFSGEQQGVAGVAGVGVGGGQQGQGKDRRSGMDFWPG